MPNLKSFKYRDSQGVYLESVRNSPTVLAAKRDPEGVRAALMRFGSLVDYHGGMIPPIVTLQGEASWQTNIDHALPLVLGIAWLNIESETPEWKQNPMDMEPKKTTTNKQEIQMPVIEWKEAAGPTTKLGFYPARLLSLTESLTGKFGPSFQAEFAILDEEGEDSDTVIRGWVGMSWTPRSTLLNWAKVLLKGNCPTPPAPINTDSLVGKKCDIEIVQGKQREDGTFWTKLSPILYRYNTVSRDDPDDDEESAPAPVLRRREAFPV